MKIAVFPGRFKSPRKREKESFLVTMGQIQDPGSEERLKMDYSTLNEVMEQMKLPEEIDALSVYRAMEQVQDGRHKRGVRYGVALMLTLLLLGKLAGMTTPQAIAEWVRLRAGWLRTVLPLTRQTFPCAATYSNVLRAVDAEQMNQVLTQALRRVRATERCGDEPSRLVGQAEREEHVHVALDGKTDAAARWAMACIAADNSIIRVQVPRGGSGYVSAFQAQRITDPAQASQWTTWGNLPG